MLPWEHPVPSVLYKYMPPERLHVLIDCRVRFSQRTVFPDDHELQPEYASFGTESEIWRYALSIGYPLNRGGLAPAVVVKCLTEDPKKQKLALESLQNNIPVRDELGVFCLTDTADSDQMWTEYTVAGKGFVIGFAAAHPGFGQLMGQGRLGKVSYSDEPIGSALATILENDAAGTMFRKRMRYAFEKEWRIIRMLHRLERFAGDLFLSPFDSASVCELIIRPGCAVEIELRQLVATDTRYAHVPVNS
jgi:hypothetical protein